MNLGAVLSRNGRSFCTYVLKLAAEPSFDVKALASWLTDATEGRSEVSVMARGQLVVRIDHALVDAQRGLQLLLQALKSAGAKAAPIHAPARPLALDPFWHASMPAGRAVSAAKDADKTVTQWLVSQLIHETERFADVRMIVTNQAADETTGNHFVPIDVTKKALLALLEKPSSDWKRLIKRLTQTSARLLAEAPAQEGFRDLLTITSVGSLDHLNETFAAYGVLDLIMYPENVSYCSSIVTIYTAFGRVHLVFSGSHRLNETLRSALDVE